MSKIHQRANQFGVVTALITRTGSYFHKKYPVILMVGLISIVAACESQSTDDISSGFAGVGGYASQIETSVTELTDVSDLVVTGEVLSAELVQKYDFSDGTESSKTFRPISSSTHYVSIRFQVDSYVKGEGSSVITIALPELNESSSALPTGKSVLIIGKDYLLFLWEPFDEESKEFWGDHYPTNGSQGRYVLTDDGMRAIPEGSNESKSVSIVDLTTEIRTAAR